MPRPKSITPYVQLLFVIPVDLKGRLDVYLFSEAEQRIPYGAYKEFFSSRIKEFFESDVLDLAPFMPNLAPGTAVVRGPAGTIAQLKRILET